MSNTGFQDHILPTLFYFSHITSLLSDDETIWQEKLLFGLNVKTAVVSGSSHRERRQSCVSLIASSGLRHYVTLLGVKKINPDEIRIWILALSNAFCLSIHPSLSLSLFHITHHHGWQVFKVTHFEFGLSNCITALHSLKDVELFTALTRETITQMTIQAADNHTDR